MTKFRIKDFSIKEGHYTGPKDLDKVPGALEIVGKSALAGAGLGAVVGSVMKESSVLSGIGTGGKVGTVTGIILKFFLNYLHNPMTTVKYQEVDKLIRREFGIYRVSGITVGDSIDKRASVDEKFSFNDRDVSKYKLNFAIQDNTVTMYTFGVTDKELDEVSNILDYYCKKYFGMEYTSYLINEKANSYSVSIVFTNYQVISNFIMELSNKLGTKINLLDNKMLVKNRLIESSITNEEKKFSFIPGIDRYDLLRILGGYSIPFAISGLDGGNLGVALSYSVLGTILGGLAKYGNNLAIELGSTVKVNDLNNKYLKKELERLHYIEGYNYTSGEVGAETNMSIASGLLIITTNKKGESVKKIDKEFWKPLASLGINRSDTGKVIVYTYPISDRLKFSTVLRKLMSLGIEINIFEK